MNVFHLLVAVFAAVQLARYARRALVFAAPGLVTVEGLPGAPSPAPLRTRAGEELEELGFVRLGVRRERAPLGGLSIEADAFAHPAEGAYADVFQDTPSSPAAVQLFTPFSDGAAVLTANFRRRGVVGPRLQAGGLPGATVAQTLAAHRVAAARFQADHGEPQVGADMEARVSAARAWYRGEGRRELRRTTLPSFVNACLAIAILAWSLRLVAQAAR